MNRPGDAAEPTGPLATLYAFFARSADLFADRTAVDIPPGSGRPERRTITYRALAADVACAATRLAPFAQRDAIIAILIERDTPHLYAAQLAVLRAGAAYTCIDPTFPDDRARTLLLDSEATAVITSRTLAGRVEKIAENKVAVLEIESLTAQGIAIAPAAPSSADALAYVIYTSGSTGTPKGVMIENRGIVNLVDSDIHYFGLTPNDRIAQGSSPSYDSSLEETWLALAVGATVVVMDDEAARLGPDLVEWLRRERITVLCPPPTLLRTTGCDDPRSALPDLKLLYVGGEALPTDIAERWSIGRRLENGYGPTECTVTVMRTEIKAGDAITIGVPVRGHTATIVDERLSPVADGTEGELVISGPGLARGYKNRPELDREKFRTLPGLGRVYRTGDLAKRRSDGKFEYLGRIDSQVKLRGYRIELEEIDVRLAALPGVREAATTVSGDGAQKSLVAFFVAEDAAHPPAESTLKTALAAALPEYMVPAHVRTIAALPRTTGGKLDRRALPAIDLESTRNRTVREPSDAVERAILECLRLALKVTGAVSIDDDFFHDLGGDSLSAAVFVSAMRKVPSIAALTVRDIYEHRTIAALAECARRGAGIDTDDAPVADHAPRKKPALFGIAQGVALAAFFVMFGASLYVSAFLVLPAIVGALGFWPSLIAIPVLAAIASSLWTSFAVALVVAAKKILIGRYTPMRVRAFGSFHFRHWFLHQLARALPLGPLQGTEFLNDVLRALGAKIGRGVHIHRGVELLNGGWDLLSIGDDVVIAQEASLRLVDYDDGHLVVGPITIGDRAVIDIRAGLAAHTSVGADAELAALSSLTEGGTIPAGERYDGVPGKAAGLADAVPAAVRHSMSPRMFGFRLVCARWIVRTLTSFVPSMIAGYGALRFCGMTATEVFDHAHMPNFDRETITAISVFAPIDVVLSLLMRALASRFMGKVAPGMIAIESAAYIRVTLKTELLDAASRWLSGTLFWPLWLRLAGMKIGPRCEISTIIDVVPELIEIGEESFLADGIYIGGPRIRRGSVACLPVRLGKNTFVGNHAVIPCGSTLPDDVLIGLSTRADQEKIRPGTSWFGHPSFELPRREVVTMDRRLTHHPGPVRFATRVFWEALRVFLAVPPLLVAGLWWDTVARLTQAIPAAEAVFIVAPLITFAATASLAIAVLLMKWALIFRVKPGQHALWSCWCSRWDFLYVAWILWARGFLSMFEGTPFLVWYLRAVGCKIGKRTLLGDGFAQVVDPDMLIIEDDATCTGLFQAHTFEDRVLKIEPVTIRRHSTVSSGSVLFYGADIGEGARVEAHGVVMKREHLMPHTRYEGAPTRRVGRRRDS